LISWTQSAPEGGLEAITGWAGMTNPAGKRLILITWQIGPHGRGSNRSNFFVEGVDKPTDN